MEIHTKSKIEQTVEQLQFAFMTDVNLQCYNGLQIKIMKELYCKVNDVPEYKTIDKLPVYWLSSYFNSEYGIKQSEKLRAILFSDNHLIQNYSD